MNETTERMYKLVAWTSLAIIVVVTVYGIIESLYVSGEPVGQVWVGVYFPFPPYFAQPVTYFSVACVALFYSGLRLWEERIKNWPEWLLMLLQLVGFVVAFSAAYEVMYNFMLWGAIFSLACATKPVCNPDLLTSTYPSQWSLVFATRAFSALFVISGYSVYFLRKFSSSSLI
ncbi:MAG: hypothetical protein JRM73_04425 [Nitrososphaerota archaeon]|nr:hypothetical protein [Nitrososphaerota archaeon]